MNRSTDKTGSESTDGVALPDAASPDFERRDALKKLAIYSAYSAPALLALMQAAKAQSSSIPDR